MIRVLTCLLLLAAALAAPAAAQKGGKKVDLFWTSPEFAVHEPRTIAMLPVATYDNNTEARKNAELAIGRALRGTGYRWVSALVTRDRMFKAGGDSLLEAFNHRLLEEPRLDSLEAPGYARMMFANALLTVRVDRYEKLEMEYNQAGKPTTTVALTAALVDSSGRLLWTASGSETAEGLYHDPNTNPVGIDASGLNNRPITTQGGAPSFSETLGKLLARWVPNFPAKPAAATPAN
ncbi:MAG: hypothetical protein IT347_11335 [Candidatus Eisenbacteria bacterium]|nr:hypothetical protein [Candidatus Eisenbacteria bacterium]